MPGKQILLFPFYSSGNWGMKGGCHLPKGILSIRGGVRIWIPIVCFRVSVSRRSGWESLKASKSGKMAWDGSVHQVERRLMMAARARNKSSAPKSGETRKHQKYGREEKETREKRWCREQCEMGNHRAELAERKDTTSLFFRLWVCRPPKHMIKTQLPWPRSRCMRNLPGLPESLIF